jgi:hypothetical protein
LAVIILFRVFGAGKRPGTAALAACAMLSACGDSDEPKPISGQAEQVAATIERLERATARRDFEQICERIFTADERRQAGGEECPDLLKRTAGDVRRPRIKIERIDVEGRKALVTVQTTAAGQKPVRERIALIRERGRWRVAALADRTSED